MIGLDGLAGHRVLLIRKTAAEYTRVYSTRLVHREVIVTGIRILSAFDVFLEQVEGLLPKLLRPYDKALPAVFQPLPWLVNQGNSGTITDSHEFLAYCTHSSLYFSGF